MRSLDEWLAHQAQVHPHAIDLGLKRLAEVLTRLRWRQPAVPVITVAGTNGKGSVVAYCAAMLGAAGYRVGTFGSPHLRDYRERIRIHDRLVTSDELVWAFDRIEAARMAMTRTNNAAGDVAVANAAADPAAAGEVSLTFFEYNALAALLLFEAARLDAWVLEVGMGGRLDAVNVVDPTVAVVVSIGFDHQEFLGTTLEAIAREKAGIFRAGRAAVIGSRDIPVALVDAAAAVGAVPKRLGVDYEFSREIAAWHYRGTRWDLPGLPPPALLGDAQFANAATAVAALEEIEARLPVSPAALARGLEAVSLHGRFQIIAAVGGGPQWILDVAHNPDAAHVLEQNLRALPVAGKTLAVFGILADKDAAAIVAQVRGCFDAWWLASTDGPRGTSGSVLAEKIAPQLTAPLHCANGVADACAAAFAVAGPRDRIVVFGSFHTVGPALDWLAEQRLFPGEALLPGEALREGTAGRNRQ